jgi:hypothetical protein
LELRSFYFSPSIIRQQVKEYEVGMAGITHGGGVHIRYWWESPKERDH